MDSREIYDYIIKIQSIAKIGLVYSTDPYALTNYNEISRLSMELLEHFVEVKFDRPNYFMRDIYPTPNISTRTIILNNDRTKVLLVREANSHTYSFPGGWADLYDSPSQAARNECLQEAGANIDIVRLVGITDRTPYKVNKSVPEYVIVFEARLKGELGEHEYETDQVGWYPVDDLPVMSRKMMNDELRRFLDAVKNGETIFD